VPPNRKTERDIQMRIAPTDRPPREVHSGNVRRFPVRSHYAFKEATMSVGTILLIIVILALIGALPTWPYSREWGYYPSGIVGVIVLVLIVMFLMGRL
jgi:hypothetical protein